MLRHDASLIWRTRIIAEALEWLGTPYRHQASEKGCGADCLGLVRGVANHIGVANIPGVPAYPQRLRASHGELMLEGFERHGSRVDNPRPADILLFRMRRASPVSHCGILLFDNRFIHAFEGLGVISTPLSGHWSANNCAAFHLPEPS